MKISEDLVFRETLIDKIAKREFSERTGVHCTDLCYCLNKQALRRLKPLPVSEHDLLVFSLGWSTQRWLTGQDKDEVARTVDGITVTCDALVLETGGEKEVTKFGDYPLIPPMIVKETRRTPWELKATFQSSNKPIEENTAWLHQIMAQCYVTETTTAYLTRLELMGNWKSIFGNKSEAEERGLTLKELKALPENEKPTLHAYRLEFTKQEVEDNWFWMICRRTTFSDLLASNRLGLKSYVLPEFQEWECQYCPQEYKTLCEAAQ